MSVDQEKDTSSQGSLNEAHKQGWRIVVPKANELLLDIDSEEAFAEFKERYTRAANFNLVEGYSARPSKSGTPGRYHVTVRVPGNIDSQLYRVALQAVLGSDWKREMYSIDRINKYDAIPTLFFEKE